ncbi:MAG: DUF3108 domain-containing protein [Candidatus Omnitrophota bacterium]
MRFYRIIVLSFYAIFISGCATSYVAKTSEVFKTDTGEKFYSKEIEIKPPPIKLPLGEKLTYQVKWLGINAGTIVANIAPQLEQINDRSACKVRVTVRTSDFCSAIYRIEDEYTSYIDAETMATLRHEVHRREGRYKKDAITDFDQQQHMAYFENLLDKSKKSFKIPENAQDTLSACYYFRTLKLKLGERIKYFVVNNEQNYELFGVIEDKKFIRIKELGNFESFFIQPYAKELNGEKVKKGKVSGYFSADEKRLPLLAVVEAPLFTKVTATLSKVEKIE